MAQFLSTNMKDFEQHFAAICSAATRTPVSVSESVRDIIGAVRERGDAALGAFHQKFDGDQLSADRFAFSEEEIDAAIAKISSADKAALDMAFARITAYHTHQKPEDKEWRDEVGAHLGWRWRAIGKVGLYVPGGTASYPSSVLMNGVPAQIAGVEALVMLTPAAHGKVNPLVLYAARLVGVRTIYRFGGAHGVAALAYGTETIGAVDKIVGPGNAYVAEAKRQLFGVVGIDMVAGPSEVVVIADAQNDPEWVAMDLLAQAEHDPLARAILITDCSELGRAVETRVRHHLERLARQSIAAQSWRDKSAIIVVDTLAEAASLSNKIAPEHLQLCVEAPRKLLADISSAGSVFLGKWTAEAMGDYIIGPNHVLPTAGSARYSSGLGVSDFMTRTSLCELTPEAFGQIGGAAARLARAEGLGAHAQSVELRLQICNKPA